MKWTKEFGQTRNNKNAEILETDNNSDFLFFVCFVTCVIMDMVLSLQLF